MTDVTNIFYEATLFNRNNINQWNLKDIVGRNDMYQDSMKLVYQNIFICIILLYYLYFKLNEFSKIKQEDK